MNKKVQTISFILSIALLTSIAPFSYAQSDEIDSKLSQTQEGVNALLEVKDSTTLSPQEKERKEIELKEQVVLGVLDLAKAQLKDAQSKLENIAWPEGKEWEVLRAYFNKNFDTYNQFYDKTRLDVVAAARAYAGDSLAQITKNLEKRKVGEIDPFVERATNVVIIFNTDAILTLADQRLEKITNDIEKIYSQKLVQNDKLKELLSQASDALTAAHKKNQEAKEVALNLYTPREEQESNQYIEGLEEKLSNLSFNEALSMQPITSTTSTSTPTASSTLTAPTASQYLQSLIVGSLKGIRSTYDIFIQMSTNVVQYLR